MRNHVNSSIPENRPARAGNAADNKGDINTNTWVEYNVSSFVTGNGTFSLAITGLNATAVSLASRESGSFIPQLVITTR